MQVESASVLIGGENRSPNLDPAFPIWHLPPVDFPRDLAGERQPEVALKAVI